MNWGNLLLRVGVGFAFLYPPFDAIFHPYNWIDFFPGFMLGYVSDTTLLWGWGAVQVVLGLWILSGKNIFIPSVLATLMLAGIVVFNLGVFDIVFRDLSIACASAALAVGAYKPRYT